MHKMMLMYRIVPSEAQNQNTDHFKGTQEEKVGQADILGLPTGPDDLYEDADIIMC